VILTAVFGDDDRRLPELRRRLLAMFSVAGSLMLQEPQLRKVPGWHGRWARFCAERAEVDKLMYSLIEDAPSGAKEGTVLSHIRQARDSARTKYTLRQIRDDVMSLILAGHEDTAAQLAWAFQLIAHHPRVLRALLSERDRDDDTYLTATIHEIMRHRPVFLFTIPRVVHHEFALRGTTIRPPAYLLGCIHLMHHEPRLYPEPQSFVPERFLNGAPAPYTWLPWGGGHKRCPGNHFALLEMRTVLRAVLARWEIQPAARKMETAQWRSVIVAPSHGSRIILRSRQHAASRMVGGRAAHTRNK
jgi:cytochrome P450